MTTNVIHCRGTGFFGPFSRTTLLFPVGARECGDDTPLATLTQGFCGDGMTEPEARLDDVII